MIRASLADSPSPHVLRRSQTMTVERLGPTEFRVTPAEEGKDVRIVRFYPEYEAPFSKYDREGKYRKPGEYGPDEVPRMVGVDIDCYAEESKEGCGANSHRRYCSHVHAAIMYLLEESATEEGG